MATYPLAQTTVKIELRASLATSTVTDISAYLIAETLSIKDIAGPLVNTATFRLKAPESYRSGSLSRPSVGQLIDISVKQGSGAYELIFSGYILRCNETKIAYKTMAWDISCVDHTSLLNRIFVNEIYTGKTISQIATDVINKYAPFVSTSGIRTCDTVLDPAISFSFIYPSQVLETLSKISGYIWFVDPNRVLQFYNPEDDADFYLSTMQVGDRTNNFNDLNIDDQIDQVRNRVYVKGSYALSDPITETWDADGQQREFKLKYPDIIANIGTTVSGTIGDFMTVDGSSQRVGIRGLSDESAMLGGFLLDNTWGLVDTAAGTPTVADGSRIEFRYRAKFPILVVREDKNSQNVISELEGSSWDAYMDALAPVHWWKLNSRRHNTLEQNFGNTSLGILGPLLPSGNIDRGVAGAIAASHDRGAEFNRQGYFYSTSGVAIPKNGYTLLAWVLPNINVLDTGILGQYSFVAGGAGMTFSPVASYGMRHNTVEMWSSKVPTYGSTYDMVAQVWDKAHGQLTLYVNGVSAATIGGMAVDTPVHIAGSGIQVGDLGYGQAMFAGRIDHPAVFDYALTSQQIRDLYAAGRQAGIREHFVSDPNITTVEQARKVADQEINKWASVITDIDFTSFVPGWKSGYRIPVYVTPNLGRTTFSGTVTIQEVEYTAMGGKFEYRVRCIGARYLATEHQVKLNRPMTVVTEPAPLETVDTIDECQGVVITGTPIARQHTPPFKVLNDWTAWSAGYIKVNEWEVVEN